MEISSMSREDLNKKLYWGDKTKIASIAEVNVMTVVRWFQHKTDNEAIERATIAVVEAREKRVAEKLSKII
ncbi:MAG TPA: hypothetical protein ENH91_00090 [Leeuwenhoekiella sp.]|nr:hypothetical protein [Leeuwenhoekiella sp.]